MNITKIKALGFPITLKITKTSQIYGHSSALRFLTNHSDHMYSSYPKITDPSRIMAVGSTVIIRSYETNSKSLANHLICEYNGIDFAVFNSDISRYLSQ
jgi:hypothetical protein